MVKAKRALLRKAKNGVRSPKRATLQKSKAETRGKACIPFRILNLEEMVKECAIALIWLIRENERGEDLIIQYKHIEGGTKLSYRSVKKVLDILEAEGYIRVTEVDYKNKRVELLI